MYIGKVSEATDEIYDALKRLIPQLGGHKITPTRDEFAALINSESSTLFIARYPDENGTIAGILTLAIYRVPTGLRSIVEDVVVDEYVRRRGIAEALLIHAIAHAREIGASGVSLTSNPRREAANLLYQSVGFKRRETNIYFLDLK